MTYSAGYQRAATQEVDHMHAGSTPTDHSTVCAHALLREIATIASTGHAFVTPNGSY
jgi:hypothetical protein